MQSLCIGIIGIGNMGTAIYKGIKTLVPDEKIFLSDPDEKKLFACKEKNIFTSAEDMIEKVDVVFLAVKPQSFADLCRTTDLKNVLLISIMAGVTIEKIFEYTKAAKIVRTMPNLPIQVGRGVIGWIANTNVTKNEKDFVQSLFEPFGKNIEIKKESMIDALTIISGSGPAYFFLLTEILEKKALDFGFTKEEAKILAEETFKGSGELFSQFPKSSEEWRNAVTSKGGTTEAVLNSLHSSHIQEIFFEALTKGLMRAKELGK